MHLECNPCYITLLLNSSSTDFPENSFPTQGLLIILLITGSIIVLAATFQESENKQLLQPIIPHQMNYLYWIHLLLFVSGLLVMLVLHIFKLFNQWTIFHVVESVIQAVTYGYVIYSSDQIKSHSYKFLKDMLDETFLRSIYVTPPILALIIYPSLYIFYNLIDI